MSIKNDDNLEELKALVDKAKLGDQEAFAALYDLYVKPRYMP